MFNFPEPEKIGDRHDVLIKKEIWDRCVEISRDRHVEVSKAINILLEGAVTEYDNIIGKVKEVSIDKGVLAAQIELTEKKAQEIKKIIQPPPLVLSNLEVKRWSKKYAACIICGTTKRRHMGKGRCTKCYFIKDEEIVDGKHIEETTQPTTEIQNIAEEKMYHCANLKCHSRDELIPGSRMCDYKDKKMCSLVCVEDYIKNSKPKEQYNNGGRWARKYDCCVGCGTTKKEHIAKGLCKTCYFSPKKKV